MDLTLDDYLVEIDRWKAEVSEHMAPLTPAGRAQEDQEALAWLERKLGRRLQERSVIVVGA